MFDRSPLGPSRPESVGRGGPRGFSFYAPADKKGLTALPSARHDPSKWVVVGRGGFSVRQPIKKVRPLSPRPVTTRVSGSWWAEGVFICHRSIHPGYRLTIDARLLLPIEETSYCDIFPLMPVHTLLGWGSHIRQSKEVSCATSIMSS